MYKYTVSIFSQHEGKPFSKDYSFFHTNPLIARRWAIQELKSISATADNQLRGLEPNNRYSIPEWDSPQLINEAPALTPILVPFSVNLYWNVGDTEYVLFGDGIQETIEALIAEGFEYKTEGFADSSLFTGLLENNAFTPAQYSQPPYLLCDGLQEIPEFDFTHHYILFEDLEFLLKHMAL
jgi:hypothetical protein